MERKRRETPWADKVEHWQQVVDPTLSCSRWQQGFRENDFKVFSPGNPPNSCNLKPLTHLCQELSKTLEAGMECRNTSSLFHTEAKYEWHVNYSGRQTWITVKKKKQNSRLRVFPITTVKLRIVLFLTIWVAISDFWCDKIAVIAVAPTGKASFVYSYGQTRKWPFTLVYVLKPLITPIRAIATECVPS